VVAVSSRLFRPAGRRAVQRRSAGVLPKAALAKYRGGLRTYQELLKTAR
jgi:hypothetical protein